MNNYKKKISEQKGQVAVIIAILVVCLLGATIGFQQDREAGLSVFNFLIKALDIKTKTK